MSEAEEILFSKAANAALFHDADPENPVGLHTLVWLGGRVTLLSDRLMFEANGVNRVANPLVFGEDIIMDFGVSFDAPLEITVGRLYGFSVVLLRLADDNVIGLRCWGARKLADRIRAQYEAVQRD